MKKALLSFLFTCFHCHSNELAEWTILTFIQANNDLNNLACYSLSHMQAGTQSTHGVNILVEWDHINTEIISRYRIIPGDMELVDSFSKSKIKYHAQALVDSFIWAKENYPAKHYAIILWDHGTGILDYIPEKALLNDSRCVSRRGILIDETKKTIYTNQDLYYCFNQIQKILHKKLDLVIMDACYMQMLEVGYQIKDFAEILVAAQEYESGEGLPYGTFMYELTLNKGQMNPEQLAKCVVRMYDLFYKHKQDHEFYTYSAVCLSEFENIKKCLDKMVDEVNESNKSSELDTYELITSARAETKEFFWDDYIDLSAFLTTLQNKIEKNISKKRNKFSLALKKLKSALDECHEAIKKVVIANVVGSAHLNSTGISIYFPITESIHESYFKTIFAQNCKWLSFLQEYC